MYAMCQYNTTYAKSQRKNDRLLSRYYGGPVGKLEAACFLGVSHFPIRPFLFVFWHFFSFLAMKQLLFHNFFLSRDLIPGYILIV